MAEDLTSLITEGRNPATMDLDTLSVHQILERINTEDARVPEIVGREIPHIAAAVELIVRALGSDGRLIYIGAGTSGRLGVLDASECPPTFGTDPGLVVGILAGGEHAVTRATEKAEDDSELGRRDIAARGVGPHDVVVGIAASGRTPYVLGAMEESRQCGAKVVALTCNSGSPMEPLADVVICPVVGPEVLMGSTRMKAGTAQKLVLNMLTTAAMVRIGKAYSNLMVDVRASNEKLVERARRIVELATGVDSDTAAQALEQASRRPKVAIVMLHAQVGPARAEALLEQGNGYVRDAIALAKDRPVAG